MTPGDVMYELELIVGSMADGHGVTLETVKAELTELLKRLDAAYPEDVPWRRDDEP